MAKDKKDDNVNHPKHYTQHPSGVECIQITEHMNFCCGNAVKYIWQADLKKDAIEDLKKAAWYVDREIKRRTRNEDKNTIPSEDNPWLESEPPKDGTKIVGRWSIESNLREDVHGELVAWFDGCNWIAQKNLNTAWTEMDPIIWRLCL